MPTLFKLLERNHQWAEEVALENPGFFKTLSEQQHPKYLWIGCSDSRVPANQITGLMPGEVFVHRNIANMVVHTDLNLLSVLQYAVEMLNVEHIIVCGHYGCGGVRAALSNDSLGLIDNWLRHIKDVRIQNCEEIDSLSEDAKLNRLCELNVLAQTQNLRRNSIVQQAWERGQSLEIHSWIYSLDDGRLKPLQDVIKAQ